jgi:hypothetical protein
MYYPPFRPDILLTGISCGNSHTVIGRGHHMEKEKKAMVITRGILKSEVASPLWHESIWSILRLLILEGG